MESCVIRSAVELGVFNGLGTAAATAERLAGEIGADPDSLGILLDALAGLEVLDKHGNRYENRHDGASNVREIPDHEGDPGSDHHAWESWSELTAIVRTGERRSRAWPAETRREMVSAFERLSRGPAEDLARQLDCCGVSRMLDLGGGAGRYSVALARRWPGLHAAVYDRCDEAVAAARALIEEHALERRVTSRQGDFFTDDLGREHDLALLSAVLCLFGETANRALLSRVRRSLRPGGRVAIRDLMPDDSGTRPPQAALFAVHMLVMTERGCAWPYRRVESWLRETGFGEIRRMPSGAACVITARLPRA
jgi:SAM-dependent methyltransferase